jgi:predicted lysophospholipase L1 biosynthesis ABC-type transport system permease subunit
VTFLPMTRWHLYNEWENGSSVAEQLTYVRIFAAIGTFILFIACINFMNLSTSRSERRAKEVGVRKSIGSNRKQLIVQFLGETLLMSVTAFVLSVIVTQAALPAFNALVYKNLQFDLTSGVFWIYTLSIIAVTSLVAGAYPAFYLSSFRPVEVLKGRLSTGRSGFLPRRVLVTVQFFFSIALIAVTIVVYQQLSFLRERQTGYNRENLLFVQVAHIESKFTPTMSISPGGCCL